MHCFLSQLDANGLSCRPFPAWSSSPLSSLSQANIGHMDTPKELWRMITGNMALIQVRQQEPERLGWASSLVRDEKLGQPQLGPG